MLEIHSFRQYGQAKLAKPTELRGVKPLFSAKYGTKASCQVFVVGGDVYIKHRDYFSDVLDTSLEDSGAPLAATIPKYLGSEFRGKGFVYSDAWGSIVLRNEAWLVLRGYMPHRDEFPPDILRLILRSQESKHGFESFELECTDMSRMWESVIRGLGSKGVWGR